MTSVGLAEKREQARGMGAAAAGISRLHRPTLRPAGSASGSAGAERNRLLPTSSLCPAQAPPQSCPALAVMGVGRRRLSRLGDEEIVALARRGDARAVELLLRRHNGLLHRVVQRFRIPGHEYEDLVQLGRMGLLRAIEQFDAGQGCRFSTLATLCILSPLNHAWASASRKARGGSSPGEVSLDALLPAQMVDGEAMDLLSLQGDERTPGPERTVVKRDECRRMLAAIRTQVTHPLAGLVIERLAQGDGLAEIGRQVGVSRQALEQLVRRMRRAAEQGMEA